MSGILKGVLAFHRLPIVPALVLLHNDSVGEYQQLLDLEVSEFPGRTGNRNAKVSARLLKRWHRT
jgi:hypothetical protein